MKRKLLLLPFFLMAVGLLAVPPKKNGGSVEDYDYEYETDYEVGTDTVEKDTTKGTSHWSIALEAGFNRFDGDIKEEYNSVVPTSQTKFMFGGALEYNIAPAWSIGLDYRYLPLAAKHEGKKGLIISDFKSTMHSVDFFTAFNLVRAFLPRTKSKWGVWTQFGLGHAWYSSKYRTDRAGTGVVNGYKQLYTDFNDTISDGRVMYYPISLLIEYNFTKSLALGLRAQMRTFNNDYVERRIDKGVTNDRLQFATLQLRWKFNAHNNDHLRNYVEPELVQQPVIDIPDYTPRLDDLERRVKRMEDILCPDGPDDDGDGVPNCRDQEPETPAGNQVDFWGRTIGKVTAQKMVDEEAFIYFDFDKTGLDYEANKAIAICARKMTADPELLVEVRGFTDNMGTTDYNARLSQRRADVVKSELIKKYGISADRIIANGKGKYNPEDKTMPFRPYRTCVLFYNK